jgi:hypothetical protein
MKQIRVKTPFLDITESNKRREAGDILLVKEERAAYLVSGELCEYVEDESQQPSDTKDKKKQANKPKAEQKPEPKPETKTEKKTTKSTAKKK